MRRPTGSSCPGPKPEMLERPNGTTFFVQAGKAPKMERQPTRLSGGLGILPHFSLAGLESMLAGRALAVVVVPHIPNISSDANRPLVGWMRRQATKGALMHSWCTGAKALAEAGLLDGRTATAHWGDLDALTEEYPRVRWLRGVRWVDHGAVITSAGLTSGVDASLRVLSRLAGDSVARRVARGLAYPNFHYASNPEVAPYSVRAADAVLLANAAFRIFRPQIGLALYEGASEFDLSSLYDTHAYSAAADVHAVAGARGFVQTARGRTLLDRAAALLPQVRTQIGEQAFNVGRTEENFRVRELAE